MTTKKNSDRNLKLFNFPSDGKSSKNILSKGLLITFEGGEGSGKSTQCKRLVKKLVDEGINSILIHEPGNTMLGEQVRKWVKSKNIQNPLAETYLFCAARAELCKSVIAPALDKGVTVIVDRFIHSTLAYQGYGKGVDLEIINNLNKITIEDYKPDLTILLDIDPNISSNRINKLVNIELSSLEKSKKNKRENFEGNRFENMNINFHNKVRNGYLEMANSDRSSWSIVGAQQSESRVADSIWKRVKRLIETHKIT